MKATQEKEADLGNSSIGKLLFKLALPAILAQIINVMYNMVDRMYIGHIADVGPSALTGVGVTMPLIMAISAFAALVSMGGAPRASIMMGKGDKETAEKNIRQLYHHARSDGGCAHRCDPAVRQTHPPHVRSQ